MQCDGHAGASERLALSQRSSDGQLFCLVKVSGSWRIDDDVDCGVSERSRVGANAPSLSVSRLGQHETGQPVRRLHGLWSAIP